MDKERSDELDTEAMTLMMSRLNPGQAEFTLGGEESQKIYDGYVSGPTQKENRGDFFICNYCGKTDTKTLKVCTRCKIVSYCSREYQLAAWPAHKKNGCVKADTEAMQLKLTWDQIIAHRGYPAPSILEVKPSKRKARRGKCLNVKIGLGCANE